MLVEGRDLFPEILLEEGHECLDLEKRALPVLDGEGIERQHLDAKARRSLDGLPHRLHSCTVARHSWQQSALCPPTIPIHDHGDMTGQPLQVQLLKNSLLG